MAAPQSFPFSPYARTTDEGPRVSQQAQQAQQAPVAASPSLATVNGNTTAIASTASHTGTALPEPSPAAVSEITTAGTDDQGPKLKTACTNCRQQKIKCRTVNDDPNASCERCSKMKLPCMFESRQSRGQPRWGRPRSPTAEITESAKRRLLARNEAESPTAMAPQTSTSMATPTSIPHRVYETGASAAVTPSPQAYKRRESVMSYSSPAQTLPRSIDGLQVDAEVIDDLFSQFFRFYHPFVPLLDPSMRPNEYYAQSSFLFWSIIAVASRRWQKDPKLMPTVRMHVQNHAMQSIFSTTAGTSTITAILLVLNWNFPETQHYDESSYIMSSALVHAAMRIGMNSPDRAQDFSRVKVKLTEEECHRRFKTYICCLLLYQRSSCTMGNNFGHFPADHSLGSQRNLEKLSPSIHYQMKIQDIISRATRAIADNGLELDNDSQIAAFDNIHGQYWNETIWCHQRAPFSHIAGFAAEADTQLYMRLALLYLSTWNFFKSPAERYFKQWKAPFEAACSLIQHLNDLERQLHVDLYGTCYILQGTALAACTLLRCLKSSFADGLESGDKSSTSRSTAQALFFSALNIIRSMSISENDKPMRCVWAMQELWRSDTVFKNPDDGSWNLDLRVRSRFASSLVMDTMSWAREIFRDMAGAYPKRGGVTGAGYATSTSSNELAFGSAGRGKMNGASNDGDIFGPDLLGDLAFTQDWVFEGWELAASASSIAQG